MSVRPWSHPTLKLCNMSHAYQWLACIMSTGMGPNGVFMCGLCLKPHPYRIVFAHESTNVKCDFSHRFQSPSLNPPPIFT